MEHKREIWDTIYLIALQGFNYVAPLIVFPYLMIVLGAEKFGYIGFSLAIVQYLMLIVDFGFNLSATKRIALARENQTELSNIFSATLFAKLGLLILSFIILLIFAFAIPRFSIYSSTLLILFLMVIANAFSFVWLFQGLGKIRIISIVNIISKLLILPLTFIFVKEPADYQKAAFILSLVYILSSLITCGIVFNNKYIKNWVKTTKKQITEEIKASYPIFLSSAATSIYTALFVIILGYYSSPSEVGKYTAVEKIMRAFSYLIFIPISQSFYPKISSMSKESKIEPSKLVRKIVFTISGMMIIVFIIMFFFSGILTNQLGKDFLGTTVLFKVMAIVPFFIGIGGAYGQLGILALGNEKEKKHFQNNYFIAAAVSLVSVVILTPIFHSLGTAIALLITEFAVCILMIWSYKRMK
ncbi:MAG: oligosaccharide flippase family protein [Paludibacter sp.]|nr:oligosaccharide flippase family protein [Paludibacter sp.]